MNRADKSAAVEQMHETFTTMPHVIVARYRGLTVNQDTELRNRVRAIGGRYQVIKNRLAKRAAAGTPIEPLGPSFTGPCAIAVHDSDPIGLAKALADFVKDNPQVELQSAVLDAKELLDAEGVKRLATMPGLPELQAQLLALIQTPATMLARLLQTPGTQLARVVDARRESQEGGDA